MATTLNFTLGSASVLSAIKKQHANRHFVQLENTTAPKQKMLLDFSQQPCLFHAGLSFQQVISSSLTQLNESTYFEFCYLTLNERQQKQLLAYFTSSEFLTTQQVANITSSLWKKCDRSYHFLLISSTYAGVVLSEWKQNNCHARFHCGITSPNDCILTYYNA